MEVYAWGRGEDGQIGCGDTSDNHQPLLIQALLDKEITHICCGSGHTLVLSRSGEVYSWGRGDDGRLGHGDGQWRYAPLRIKELSQRKVGKITCGSYHSACITLDGTLMTWGGGMYGKLGHGDERGHTSPCPVKALSENRVVEVACGSRHTVCIDVDNNVHTWGDKENGVCGHGSNNADGHQTVPLLIDSLRDAQVKIVHIAACGFHTLAASKEGQVFSWGEGKFGRLGHGNEENKFVPTLIEGLAEYNITHVAAGGFHSAAISDSGLLFTWGGGEHGQLGIGDKTNRHVPSLVESLKNEILLQAALGWSHSVALSDKGVVYSWGNGDHGKLGHKDCAKVSFPRPIETLNGKRVCRIGSYNEHTVALSSSDSQISKITSSFMSDLKSMVNNGLYSDVTFIVEDMPIYAHRSFLSVRSDHFRAMFSSGMIESTSNEIVIQSIQHKVFLALMEFMYTDTVQVSPEVAIQLYVAADLYCVERLKGLCEVLVQRNLSTTNVCKLLSIADDIGAHPLRALCLKYVARHFDDVSKTGAFEDLSKLLILEVVKHR